MTKNLQSLNYIKSSIPHVMLMYDYTDSKNTIVDQGTFKNQAFTWTDLYDNLETVDKDLKLAYNLRAIKNSIDNILLTRKYEIAGRPEFGSNLIDFLGDQIDSITKHEISMRIKSNLQRYEPRILVDSVEFEDNEANETRNILVVVVNFRIVSDENDKSSYQHKLRIGD